MAPEGRNCARGELGSRDRVIGDLLAGDESRSCYCRTTECDEQGDHRNDHGWSKSFHALTVHTYDLGVK